MSITPILLKWVTPFLLSNFINLMDSLFLDELRKKNLHIIYRDETGRKQTAAMIGKLLIWTIVSNHTLNFISGSIDKVT